MTSDNKMVNNSPWAVMFPQNLLSLSLCLSSVPKKFPQPIISFIPHLLIIVS